MKSSPRLTLSFLPSSIHTSSLHSKGGISQGCGEGPGGGDHWVILEAGYNPGKDTKARRWVSRQPGFGRGSHQTGEVNRWELDCEGL